MTQLAGILTCILALVQAGGIFYLILGRNPLAFAERETVKPSGEQKRQAHVGSAVPQG